MPDSNTPCRFVALSVANIELPATMRSAKAALSQIASIAMLVAERSGDRWSFDLRSRAVGAGDGEDRLLEWAIVAMPEAATVIGWKLADDVVAPLLDAAREGDPDVAAAFLQRLLGLVTAPCVDLALGHGGAGAPSLTTVAAAHGIEIPVLGAEDLETAWAFGRTEQLAAHSEAQAVAAWRLWLAEANGVADDVAQAFARWRRG